MSLKIEGLDKVLADLKKFGDRAEKGIKREVNISVTSIERNAIQKAPFEIVGIQTGIKQLINKRFEDNGFSGKVGVEGNDPFPAYVEFGTGTNFTDLVAEKPQLYTADVQEIAYNFFVNGLGTLPASPYLFPSFFEERTKFVDNLRKELDKLAS
jgi:hypothetical protein